MVSLIVTIIWILMGISIFYKQQVKGIKPNAAMFWCAYGMAVVNLIHYTLTRLN